VVRLDFDLVREPVALSPIEVRAQREISPISKAGPAPVRIDARTVSLVPALAEADVLRAVQTLPSVAAASDFSSALYVRGGSPDQNLITLDGVPLFNPYHLGGVFGSVDPDAVASVDMLPGAFPARIGDRLSGVVDIRTRDGGRDQVRGTGGIGLISSRAGVDGPLPGGRGSYLFSARRTYLDFFTDAAYRLDLINTTLPYAFTDAHLKLTHDVGAFGRISASVYLNEEQIRFPEELKASGDVDVDTDFRWGSRMAALSYRQPFNPALVGEFRLAVTDFHGRWDAVNLHYDHISGAPLPSSPVLNARTTMRDLLAAADFVWYRSRHETRWGLQVDSYLFDHQIDPFEDQLSPLVFDFQRTDQPRTVAVYAEDEWSATDALTFRGGLRVLYAGDRGTAWMPRVGARYALSPELSVSAGAGRYAQVLHTLRDEESLAAHLLAYDFLGAVPGGVGLSTADDMTLGAEWQSGGTRVRVDSYVKWMRGLLLPPVPTDAFAAPVLVRDEFQSGTGRARGLEVLASHMRGTQGLSLAYALAWAERERAGERFAPRFERRHTLDLAGYTALGKQGQGTARLVLATGQPYTKVLGLAPGYSYRPAEKRFSGGVGAVLLGEHNTDRLPGYLRLDLGARKQFDRQWFGRAVSVTPYVHILNVLNTKNVIMAHPETRYGGRNAVLEYTPQLPVFPTFGVEWKF
jgi:hypothetical protein